MSDLDRNTLTAVLAPLREAREVSRRLRREKVLERRRRAQAIQADRERIGRRLLELAGLDPGEIEQRRKHEAEQTRAFIDEQRRAVNTRAREIAKQQEAMARRRGSALSLPRDLAPPHGLVFRSLLTLDTARWIDVTPTTSQPPYFQIEVDIGAPAPLHNTVKIYAWDERTAQHGFHIPGLPYTIDADFVFAWTADSDVALNAITFVQPNGTYLLETWWGAFVDSEASASLTAGLDVVVVDRTGTVVLVSNGTRDDGLTADVQTGWFDFTGAFEYEPYNDMSDLFDNGLLEVNAGNTAFFSVWVELAIFADGNAISSFDFRSGDFGINVPAVYVPTFQAPS